MQEAQKKTTEAAVNEYGLPEKFLSAHAVQGYSSLRGIIKIVITISYLDPCSELFVEHEFKSVINIGR